MLEDTTMQLLDQADRSAWCGDRDDTGRYVCRLIRDHGGEVHAGRVGDGVHQWPVRSADEGGENMPAATPAAVDEDALRRSIAEALAAHPRLANLFANAPAAYLGEDPGTAEFRHSVPGYLPEADAVLAAVLPTLNRLHAEVARIQKLADANSKQARYWADTCHDTDRAIRSAFGPHHKRGYSIVELVVSLRGELDNLRASREAWAIEADRLDVIATAARYFVQPADCDGADCNHDDEVCVHMDERYATFDDAVAAGNTPAMTSHNERLLQIAAQYGDLTLAVADALGLPVSTSTSDLIEALASRPAIPAGRHKQLMTAVSVSLSQIAASGDLPYRQEIQDAADALAGRVGAPGSPWDHQQWRDMVSGSETAAAKPQLHSWRIGDDPGPDRALMVDAAKYVINSRHAAVTAVQRNIRVGFAKAARLLDMLETWGVVGPAEGSTAREVLVGKDELAAVLTAIGEVGSA